MITVCRICGKPIALMNLAPVPIGYYCQCPIAAATTISPMTPTGLSQCPRCRWYVNQYMHTHAECSRLAGLPSVSQVPATCREPRKEEVPQAFYEAFADEELEL